MTVFFDLTLPLRGHPLSINGEGEDVVIIHVQHNISFPAEFVPYFAQGAV